MRFQSMRRWRSSAAAFAATARAMQGSIVWMHPDVGRDLPLLRQLDHMHWRPVSPSLARSRFQQGIRSGFHGSFVNLRAVLIEDYNAARLVHQLGEINCDVTRDQISLSFGILFGLAIESDGIV
jgi:hypothetical protein